MKDLMEFIVKYSVDHPENVAVTEVGGEHVSVLELNVGVGDAGRVIGKRGRTAGALRTILTAAAAKQNKRMMLEIID
jgi:predicted RNA-binding protein YlqC (UPF0109 family)